MIHLTLFGAPSIEHQGRNVDGPCVQGRQLALLGLLAVQDRQPLRRDRLIAVLWPECDTDTARHRLTQVIYTIRTSLSQDVLQTSGDQVRLNHDAAHSDVQTFIRSLSASDLTQAVGCYTGTFMDGFHLRQASEFADWLERQREDFRSRAADAGWTLATQAEADNRIADAVKHARWAANLTLTDDRAHERLMELLDRAGDRGTALRVHNVFTRRMREEYELDLAPSTAMLAAQIRRRTSSESRRIAVLPFDALPHDVQGEALALGMTEEIVEHLGRVRGLAPIGRSTVMQYRGRPHQLGQVAAELQVQFIIEGTIRQQVNRVRVTARLLDAATETVIWGNAYDRELDDMLILQEEIAAHVVGALHGLVTDGGRHEPAQRLIKPDAYREYVLGRRLMYGPGTEKMQALSHLQAAAELDPSFARPHATLALLNMLAGEAAVMPPEVAFQNARACAERALALEAANRDANVALAGVAFWYDWDWAAAERLFLRARALGPSTTANAYVPFCTVMGRIDNAIETGIYDVELDPLSPFTHASLGWVYGMCGRYQESLTCYRTALVLDPEFALCYALYAWMQTGMGDSEGALESLAKIPDPLMAEPVNIALAAYVYAAAGRNDRAVECNAQLSALRTQRYVDPWSTAVVHTALNQPDDAFSWLENAYAQRSPHMVYLGVAANTLFRNVRADSRFQSLLSRMNLPVAASQEAVRA